MSFGGFIRGLRKVAVIVGRAMDNPAVRTVTAIWVPPSVIALAIAGAQALDKEHGKTKGQKHQELKDSLLDIAGKYNLGPTEVDQLIKAVISELRGKGVTVPMLDDPV